MSKHVCMIAYTGYAGDARVRREAETLALNEYKVSFLVPRAGAKPRRYELDNVDVTEVNVKQYYGTSRVRYFLSYMRFLLACLCICSWRCLTRGIDIVHVHNMPNFLVFASIFPRLAGKKVILDIHDTVPETYLAKFGDSPGKPNLAFRMFCGEESLCCRFAHKLICANHTQKEVLVDRGIPEEKISVSLNVPDHRRFSLQHEDGTPTEQSTGFKLIYHGTLAKRLGLDLAIRAVGVVAESVPDVEFHILGGGDDKQEFVDLTKSLGLERHVIFGGSLPVDQLVPVLQGMDVGVIPNRKSLASDLMLPVKMLEYIALDIPVVAPRLKTIQYYFSEEEEMVRYYQSEDVDDLARAILELHADAALRERQAQHARKFLDRYGWERHQRDLVDLYSVLSNGASPRSEEQGTR